MLSKALSLACEHYIEILYNEEEDWMNEIFLCSYFVSCLENKQISELFCKNLTLDDINLLFAACEMALASSIEDTRGTTLSEMEFLEYKNVNLKLIISKINTYRITKKFEYTYDEMVYIDELKKCGIE
jgi:hypothetical protein